MDNELLFFNAFNQIPSIGPVRFRKLLTHFPNLETAWRAGAAEFLAAGLEDNVVAEFMGARGQIDPEEELAKLKSRQVELLTIRDAAYPKLLKEIPNPPAVLYIKGELLPADELSVAVVGTRKISPYGRQVAEDIVRQLTGAGVTITSGLAARPRGGPAAPTASPPRQPGKSAKALPQATARSSPNCRWAPRL